MKPDGFKMGVVSKGRVALLDNILRSVASHVVAPVAGRFSN